MWIKNLVCGKKIESYTNTLNLNNIIFAIIVVIALIDNKG